MQLYSLRSEHYHFYVVNNFPLIHNINLDSLKQLRMAVLSCTSMQFECNSHQNPNKNGWYATRDDVKILNKKLIDFFRLSTNKILEIVATARKN